MREKLISKINRALDPFVGELIALLEDIKDRERELDKKLLEVQEERNTYKLNDEARESQLNKELENYKTKHLENDSIRMQLDHGISDCNNQKREIKITEDKVKQALKSAELERDIAVKERTRAADVTKKISIKLSLLQNDDNKNKAKTKELSDRETKIKAGERANLMQEERNSGYKRDVEDLEVELKYKQKQIDIELRRLKLDGSR